MHSILCLGYKIGNSSTATTFSYFANCPRCSSLNRVELARCSQNCYASLYQKKTFYDKKANASKLKEADYVYVSQRKADHHGSKFPLREFRWLGPYNIEKVLPSNCYLVRKIGTNKTQVLHRMLMR